ncbi:hypothetical protein QBC33DRAFT_558790 [Phialemonium atrogriseum]|uniref:Uncharacterized protein n=1 Tax=Phialemonium atrogriseum TaxID=1093897 RepID=A0AAJ0C225_9PEZI|nr:uncharacterized protein QBC33DRAFT_558790 [Phialemonium atrogriseum]KAK1767299.1 hypothetical protein QBC33DRAFT_558790 [Phialemonium atrogriseum]
MAARQSSKGNCSPIPVSPSASGDTPADSLNDPTELSLFLLEDSSASTMPPPKKVDPEQEPAPRDNTVPQIPKKHTRTSYHADQANYVRRGNNACYFFQPSIRCGSISTGLAILLVAIPVVTILVVTILVLLLVAVVWV